MTDSHEPRQVACGLCRVGIAQQFPDLHLTNGCGCQCHEPRTDPRNVCARCRRVVAVEFVAPPDLWLAAAGSQYEHEHLCIGCFDELVPADWPMQWESVTTLWPISRKRAVEAVA